MPLNFPNSLSFFTTRLDNPFVVIPISALVLALNACGTPPGKVIEYGLNATVEPVIGVQYTDPKFDGICYDAPEIKIPVTNDTVQLGEDCTPHNAEKIVSPMPETVLLTPDTEDQISMQESRFVYDMEKILEKEVLKRDITQQEGDYMQKNGYIMKPNDRFARVDYGEGSNLDEFGVFYSTGELMPAGVLGENYRQGILVF